MGGWRCWKRKKTGENKMKKERRRLKRKKKRRNMKHKNWRQIKGEKHLIIGNRRGGNNNNNSSSSSSSKNEGRQKMEKVKKKKGRNGVLKFVLFFSRSWFYETMYLKNILNIISNRCIWLIDVGHTGTPGNHTPGSNVNKRVSQDFPELLK